MSARSAARPILILAGGTGGHVYPALAVAAALRAHALPVHWLGGARGIEARLVPAAGIAFTALPGRGLRGTGLGRKLLGGPRLAVAVARAWRLIRRIRPRAALGFGGYASGAGGIAAWLARCPLLIHEQNAIAGTTNKALSRFAVRLLAGFPGVFGVRTELTGNPVREAFAAIPAPKERYRERTGTLRLLVTGGSQGASALNKTLPAALAQAKIRFEVRHVAGPRHEEATRAAYAQAGVATQVIGYEEALWERCAWADFAIARAGALTLAELAAAGLPAVLVPFPAAVDDHQTANARVFEAAGAARLLLQSDLTPESLAGLLNELSAGGREGLLAMAECARNLACPDAAERVARTVLEVAEAGR
ncbi:MAG: undecaprenyldiphospho-muramoylpentapeptide beta-N-acetylglucosaminyltransferase [Gammaproteobacteria bacterium]